MNDFRIPVTVITGFLGAGKTTLLNQLIENHPKKKFAIIENEFGKIGIDSDLIIGINENIFELNNGCICCSLNSDFYQVIDKLLNSKFVFNHLLVETTGIADPLSIINAFLDGGGIQDNFKIDSVVCVVDAINIQNLIHDYSEIRKQLSVADLIIINKIDAADKTFVDKLTREISEISTLASIKHTSFCDISKIQVLDTDSYAAPQIEMSTLKYVHHNQPQKKLNHNHEISTVAFQFDDVFDFSKFSLWIQNFIFFNSNKILRIKGILAFQDYPERFIFHTVVDSFLLDPGKNWDQEKPFSKIIFIGKHLDKDELHEGLEQLLVN
ncbi:MAG: GTP-binding protein [Bacteroidota bacterium]